MTSNSATWRHEGTMNQATPIRLTLPLDALTLDPELQPRAQLDRPTWEDYALHLAERVVFPPVLAVRDGDTLWLADGYHRWHAHKALGVPTIEAEVRPGTRLDALRYSLTANATHGKPRTDGDYRRAYGIAVSNRLIEPTDTNGLMQLTGCSSRMAEGLTKTARDRAKAERDAAWEVEKASGKPVKEIAQDHGVSERTVRGRLSERQKAQAAQIAAPPAPTAAQAPAGLIGDITPQPPP